MIPDKRCFCCEHSTPVCYLSHPIGLMRCKFEQAYKLYPLNHECHNEKWEMRDEAEEAGRFAIG